MDFVQNALSLRGFMYDFQVIFDPLDKMVLECSLDYLMEEVRGEEFMNICAWEAHCEWL